MPQTNTISFVLTSCNRFDLLEKTLTSFFKYNSYPIAQYIIIEDSHNRKNLESVLSKFSDVDFVILNNDPQVGQMKSIDKAYSYVTSDYIFHCEEDWEFYKEGFIEKSFDVLNAESNIVTVWLREQDDTNGHPVEPNLYYAGEGNTTAYQIMQRNHQRRNNSKMWHGFTFNPGLRRLKDYQIFAPIAQYDGEAGMSVCYHDKGFKAAIFPEGFVRHLGYHRGIHYELDRHPYYKDLSVFLRKAKTKIINIFK